LVAEGVQHLALFGSRARGDNRPDSDIDLLVEVPEEDSFSILNLIGVEHAVSDNLGLKANAIMRRSLRDNFRASIEPDIVDIF
jgi:predicted nucleotidyltransferase